MMRRASWLVAGVGIGAGGALWARRRLEVLSERLRSRELPGDIAKVAGRGARAGAQRVRVAVDDGRRSAREREDDLWRGLEVRARTD